VPTQETNDQAFFTRLEDRQEGLPLPRAVRTFIRLGDWPERWTKADTPQKTQLENAAWELVENLGASGLLEAAEHLGLPGSLPTLPRDERWSLVRDLMKRATGREWRPVMLRRTFHMRDGFPRTEHRVEIDVDRRVSLKALKAELDRLWPQLRDEGWVLHTRPLGERAIALARLVCLESQLGDSWRARLDQWNDRYPQWRIDDVRAFTGALRRVERQLTGRNYGLAWFYDSDAQMKTFERMSRADLAALPPHRKEHARRLIAASIDAFSEATNAYFLYESALRRQAAAEKALEHLQHEPTSLASRGADMDDLTDEEDDENEEWNEEDEEIGLWNLGLEGHRLPRTDLGEWVWHTPYDNPLLASPATRPGTGAARNGSDGA
jgi:hypothetical protein